MNPIWKREFFARWRDWRAHLLLFALTLLLAVLAYWSYRDALSNPPLNYRVYPYAPVAESVATRASRTGHALFTALALGNVTVWFLLAPLLTATGVARERERGLLELLQLSPMSPVSQIVARALSALAYLGALQLVTVPVYVVAFSLGGVSVEEILNVWAIVAASAFCCVGVGIALSAQSHRPSSALFGAVTVLVVWTMLSIIGGDSGVWTWYLGIGPYSRTISSVLLYSYPISFASEWIDKTAQKSFGGLGGWLSISPVTAFPWVLGGWTLVGILGLWKATYDVKRTLPLLGWAGRNPIVQKWKQRRTQRLKQQREKRIKASVEGALLADIPLDRLIRFKNPLLNREVRSRFRLKRGSLWVWAGRSIIILGGVVVWGMAVFAVFFDPPSRIGTVSSLLWGEWLLGAALIATFSASTFVREREAGTWEGIRLSLFSASELTFCKWGSPLIAFALLSSPLWLLLFVLMPWGNWPGVPAGWIFLSALVVAASLCWICALGTWISLRAKTTASALCWTIGLVLVIFAGGAMGHLVFDVSGRVASWYYKTNGLFTHSNDYYGNREPYLQLYEKETGRHIKRYTAGTRSRPSIAERNESQLYSQWYREKQQKIERLRETFDFWNPILVLIQLQNRGNQTYASGFAFILDEGTLAEIALLHMALAGTGTLVLLLGVRARLNRQLD